MLDQALLKQLVHYDPETGVFTRLKISHCRAPTWSRWDCLIGKPMGRDSHGYLRANVMGRDYPLHRLAWFYMTGKWPDDEIDHINRDRADNRWCNLRPADSMLQMGNINRQHRSSKSGVRGVHQASDGRRWVVHIKHDGKQYHLGTFETIEEAKACYDTAARAKFGEHYRPY